VTFLFFFLFFLYIEKEMVYKVSIANALTMVNK
jgi:hypothetical protein